MAKIRKRTARRLRSTGRVQRIKVNITVKNGTVQDIEFTPKIRNADITIYDYDVDGLEEKRICKEGRGKPCLIAKC